MIITYSSNNSGGTWWLSYQDWKNLEAAGWEIDQQRTHNGFYREAAKELDSVADAILDFEKIVGQSASDEGCNCCGPPHSFKWVEDDHIGYASGEECLQYLYPGSPTSLREAIERSQ